MGLSKKKTLIVYKLVLGRVSNNPLPSSSNKNAKILGRVLGLHSAHPYVPSSGGKNNITANSIGHGRLTAKVDMQFLCDSLGSNQSFVFEAVTENHFVFLQDSV